MKVAILGTGPSAAYAGMACESAKVEYEIISNRSPLLFFPGAFWARLNPLDFEIPAFQVYISSVGTAIGYLKKQWNMVDPDWLSTTSFPKESRKEIVFDPSTLFSIYWSNYPNIYLTPSLTDSDISELAKEYDLVFLTFPTEKSIELCGSLRTKFPIVSFPTDSRQLYCVYDGVENQHTVRMSSLFGFIHNEYAQNYIPKMELVGENGRISWVPDFLPDIPPVVGLRDVPADNVILVGRWAQWDRKILSHNAYSQVLEVLQNHV